MRKHLLVLALILGSIGSPAGFLVAPGWAQAPPPVPAEPDTERRTRYTGVSSVTTFPVTFDIYGDGTDFTSWVEVWVNGVNQVGNWSLVPTSGSFTTLARPLLAANLNIVFTSGQTGTVDIVGARRPRRTSQLSENQGVPARAFNQVITDLWMTLRETWDRTNDISGRAIMGVPGDQLGPLPPAATRAGQFICFGPAGQLATCAATSGSSTIQAGNGIIFTGSSPTNIAANFAAGTGIALTGTSLITVSRAAVATRAVTGNDTSSSTDCSRVILATGGLTTLTLPAASSVPAGCEIGYANAETYSGTGTGRGKKLANFPADFGLGNILYPTQSGKVVSDGSVWRTSAGPSRWKTSQPVVHVDTTFGSDTGDCLGTTTGACQTPQAALTRAQYYFDNGGSTPIIAMACGQTHTSPIGWGGTPLGTNLVQISPDGNCSFNWFVSGSNKPITVGDGGELDLNLTYYGASGAMGCTGNIVNVVSSSGCIYMHGPGVVLDLEGTPTWFPSGANDNGLFCDRACQVTVANGWTQGAGSGGYIFNQSAGGLIAVSGTVSGSTSSSLTGIFYSFGNAVTNLTTATAAAGTWTGGVGTSKIYGSSVFVNNGLTPAGGITIGASSVNCTSISSAC